MYRSILLSAAAIALVAGSISAQACAPRPGGTQPPVRNLSHIKLPAAEAAPLGYGSIVGVWNNSVVVNGQVVLKSIATWHSDGTEFDNVDLPPIVGNICAGVWESRGIGKVVEHHIGWTFDGNGNPSGYFTLVQDLKLGNHGTTYSGPFDQKFYDNDGNLVNELTGDMSAERFTGQ